MRRFLPSLVLTCVALLCALPVTAQPTQPGFLSKSLTSATCTSNASTGCVVLQVPREGSIGLQLAGTFSATVEFEGSIDGTTFVSMVLAPSTGGAGATSATSAGVWTGSAGGLRFIRARVSAYTSGSVDASLQSAPSGGGGGSSSGGVVSVSDGTDTVLVSAGGEIAVTCASCSGSGVGHIDDAAFTVTSDDVVPIAGVFLTDSVGAGEAGAVRMSANRNLFITIRDAAGNERGLNVDAAGAMAVNIASETADVGIGAAADADPGAGQPGSLSGKLRNISLNTAVLTNAISGTGVNISQIGGANVDLGNGAVGGSTQRVTLAGNSTGTIASITTSIVPGTAATNLGKAVDSAFGATDTVVAIGCVRDDALSTLTPAENDYANCRVNSTGALYVTTAEAGLIDDAIFADDAAFTLTSSKVMAAGFIRDDALSTLAAVETDVVPGRVNSLGALHVANTQAATPVAPGAASATVGLLAGGQYNLTPPTFTDGQQGSIQLASDGSLKVTGGGGGTEYVVNAAVPTDPTGSAPLCERDDALGTLSTEADGEWTNCRTNNRGATWVAVDGTALVGDGAGALNVIVDSGTLTVTDGAGALNVIVDSATLGTVTVSDGAGALNVIIDSSAALTVGDGAGALNVIVDSGTLTAVTAITNALPAGTNNIGDVDVASIAAGNNNIGDVDIASGTITTVSTVTNLSQFGGAAINLGSGTISTGTLRMTIATDDPVNDAAVDTLLALVVEDAAETAANQLLGIGTVRRDTAASSAGTTGDNATLNTDAVGALWVNPFSQTQAATTYLTTRITDGTDFLSLAVDATHDSAAVATGPNILAEFDDGTPDAVDEGDAGRLRISANRNLYATIRDAAGNERGVNVNASNEMLVACSGCSASGTHVDDAAFTVTSDDGGASFFLFDDAGPDPVNEGDAGIGRMSANRNQYTTIRDAAGNERGVNVDASGQIGVTVATFPDNEPFNVQQWAGSTATGGAGAVAAGSPRVTIATDDEINDDLDAIATSTGLLDNAISGAGFNITQFGGAAVNLNAGAAGTGTLRIVTATDDPVNDAAVLFAANLVAHDAADAGSPLKLGGFASATIPAAVTANDRVNAWYTLNGAAMTQTTDPCSGPKIHVPVSITADATLITGTASNRTYICAVSLVTATAQNIAVLSGTGTTCQTSTGPLFGGVTAATGWNFAANTGIAVGTGSGTIAKSDTDADNICIDTSSTGQISGSISYVVAPN